ncbi:hypothetical protein ACRE1U_04365 [Helicobacter himalayensis]|uniref:hypothetical protein n=1 Tax=Helicobacter himalayensis TaxID=1591088 RepID=UPI003D6F1CF2
MLNETDCIDLFSQDRLNAYSDLQEHEDNFALIGDISYKIGILEIILRSKIHRIMLNHNPKWLTLLIGSGFENLSQNELISKQSFGFWVKVVEHFKIHNKIFDKNFLDNLDFKTYYKHNKNSFSSNHNRLLRHHKVSVIMKLLHLLRNRAFHFENLYKMNKNGPRLSVTICNVKNEKLVVSLHPKRIIYFVNDILGGFNQDLLDYGSKKHPKKEIP